MKKLFACVFFSTLAAGPIKAEDALNYIAIGVSDGPSPAQRVVVVVQGTNAHDVVLEAYRSCYEKAVVGYMKTCKIGYGNNWVVGTVCFKGKTPVFDVETDEDSAEIARTKGYKYLIEVESAMPETCHEIAEYNANKLETARSVAKDKAR